MKIEFEKIRYKNAFSFGDDWTEFDLQKSSTTLFIGENGAGKSSAISDALAIALYGQAHRDIVKATIVNTINERKAVWECEFSIGLKKYKVVRGIKPDVFELWLDGERVHPGLPVPKLQEYLETEVLKMSFKAFCQIVVIGKARYTPFMKLKAEERRAFIENILDIGILSEMNKRLKVRVSSLREEMMDTQKSIDIADTKISASTRFLAELSKSSDEQVAKLQQEINGLQEEKTAALTKIENIQSKITELLDTVKDNSKLTKKIAEFVDFRTTIKTKHAALHQEVTFFQKNAECPTCTQEISEIVRNEKIVKGTSKIKEYENGLEALKTKIASTNDKLQVISQTNAKIISLQSEVGTLQRLQKVQDAQIASKTAEISKLTTKTGVRGTEEETLEAAKADKERLLNVKSTQLDTKQYQDVSTVALKDTGIKTRVIKKYLPVLNQLIRKYLEALEFFISFDVNENFEETINSKHRKEFKYNNFSEGQKLRIDLALTFAFRDIAKKRNGMDTNLLVFDETFDSSLDNSGVDDLLRIVNTSQDMNIFVVSHRAEYFKDVFARTYFFRLKGGFTEIEEIK